MALLINTFKQELSNGFVEAMRKQRDSMKEDDSSEEVIKKFADSMADVVSKAVDKYIKSGDISIGPTNITVTTPAGPGVVAPASPAKMK